MLKALRNDAKRKGLNACDGFIAVLAIAHDTSKVRHFGQPPTILFAFKLDREGHAAYCTIRAGCLTRRAAPVGAAGSAADSTQRTAAPQVSARTSIWLSAFALTTSSQNLGTARIDINYIIRREVMLGYNCQTDFDGDSGSTLLD